MTVLVLSNFLEIGTAPASFLLADDTASWTLWVTLREKREASMYGGSLFRPTAHSHESTSIQYIEYGTQM